MPRPAMVAGGDVPCMTKGERRAQRQRPQGADAANAIQNTGRAARA